MNKKLLLVLLLVAVLALSLAVIGCKSTDTPQEQTPQDGGEVIDDPAGREDDDKHGQEIGTTDEVQGIQTDKGLALPWDSSKTPATYTSKGGEQFPSKDCLYIFDHIYVYLDADMGRLVRDGYEIDWDFEYTEIDVNPQPIDRGDDRYRVRIGFTLPISTQEHAIELVMRLEEREYVVAAGINMLMKVEFCSTPIDGQHFVL